MKYEQLTLDWCYSCWRAEPIPPSGVYASCGECGHLFETAEDLLNAYNFGVDGLCRSVRADEIGFCPLCMHNF